jgi:hypothetical protein
MRFLYCRRAFAPGRRHAEVEQLRRPCGILVERDAVLLGPGLLYRVPELRHAVLSLPYVGNDEPAAPVKDLLGIVDLPSQEMGPCPGKLHPSDRLLLLGQPGDYLHDLRRSAGFQQQGERLLDKGKIRRCKVEGRAGQAGRLVRVVLQELEA